MSDKFAAPKPLFAPPKDNGLLSPKDQTHHIPAPSLVERAQNDGQDKIAQLLAKAREQAKEQAKIIETKSSPKKKSSESKTPFIEAIDPNYITTPEECIKRTRAGNGFNIHDPEVKKLFWANGGDKFVQEDLTYPMSFENWRRYKLTQANSKFKNEIKIPYGRSQSVPSSTKRFVPGLPSQDKFIAQNEAKNRQKNSYHYGFVSPPIKRK